HSAGPPHPSTVAAWYERQAALEDALFKDCGIERGIPDDWKRLALVLAERHVPAFGPDVAKKRGRPPPADDDENLVRAMHELVVSGKSIRAAARIIANRRKETANGVEARYRRILADWRRAHKVWKYLLKRRARKMNEVR